jgi:hydrogenase maturation protein HypF
MGQMEADGREASAGMGPSAGAKRFLIKVKGTVQGVGFRPYVYGLATSLFLRGHVANTSEGVVIDVEGEEVESFIGRLGPEAPTLARVDSVEASAMPPAGYEGFSILESREGGSFTLISPDVSTCPDCLREFYDPADRRHLYPFINCTNCGPRYSITRRTPYDRPNTTMAVFRMCPECEAEYRDPSNRRFHAEPNACPVCGPRVELLIKGAGGGWAPFTGGEPVEAARGLLSRGSIVAIKGLGGFHLACDALNAEAVARLRRMKRRSNKPFALMARDVETIRRFCLVSEVEEGALVSGRRPIVLLAKKSPQALPEAVAPGNARLGFMLPYTPLHYLIFGDSPAGGPGVCEALVMTSGNLSEEPIQIDGGEAASKLGHIADAFLLHDREIFMRADDSVVKLAGGSLRFVRRSRGYAPEPVPLREDGPEVLAAGADIKNTFTIMKGPYAVMSQHIGDMENYETLSFFEEVLENLKAVYRAAPEALAFDLHPGYLSTRWARSKAGMRLLGVQHHHAHIASVMAEHGLTDRVIGVAFDGTGYGTDGTLWGGEFLVADALGFRRAGHLRYVPLPGGERAVREPWRTAVSYLGEALGEEARDCLRILGFYERYGGRTVEDVLKVAGIREVSPLSSGAGRLFDAVSALLGVSDRNTFEGEAAIALEAAAEGEAAGSYPFQMRGSAPFVVDFSLTLRGIISDLEEGAPAGEIAARFHGTVIEAVARAVSAIALETGLREVALSGGVFQNDCLLVGTVEMLEAEGMRVYTNSLVPANDAGISLGQAYILREKLKAGGV